MGPGIKPTIVIVGSSNTDMVIKAEHLPAAGDVFNGALVVALSEGNSMQESTRFACKAAAISVTKISLAFK